MYVPLHYSLLLAAFTLLFILRVCGQILVVVVDIDFLPPFEQWYSGLLPYSVLLPIQILIIGAMLKIVLDFAKRSGFFITPKPRAAVFIKWFSYVYFFSMGVRYVITMTLYPELRWFTDTIPIWFHMVLAAFLYTFSHYHLRQGLITS
ncbi:MAG: hypothetical protein E2O38_06765 [Proteobacteria bacterium]|nr:MAG: hypothetical protein E2O38_06765 [Pseudomonadota bacterium]